MANHSPPPPFPDHMTSCQPYHLGLNFQCKFPTSKNSYETLKLLTKFYKGDKIEEGKVGGLCGM